jgi:hypothetical protein
MVLTRAHGEGLRVTRGYEAQLVVIVVDAYCVVTVIVYPDVRYLGVLGRSRTVHGKV